MIKRFCKKWITGLLCVALLFSNILSIDIQVSAAELESVTSTVEEEENVESNIGLEENAKNDEAENTMKEELEKEDMTKEEIPNEEGVEEEEPKEEEFVSEDTEKDNQEESESEVGEDNSETEEADKENGEEDSVEDENESSETEQEKEDIDEDEILNDNEDETELDEKLEIESEAEKVVDENVDSLTAISGECGYNLIWTLENGTLTISGTGNMYDYVRYSGSSAPWTNYTDDMQRLVIQNGVNYIGKDAFYGCSGFCGDLIIPDSVTEIGAGAFEECNGFSGDLIIPSSVIKIRGDAFRLCRGFSGNLIIPNSVTEIGRYAFEGCSGLSGDLIIPDSIKEIEWGVFDGCSGFNGSLTIPNSVNDIGWAAFAGCSGFSGNLTIPANIGDYAFYECSGFESLTIRDGVTRIGEHAFESCSGFSGNLTIPDSVIEIGGFAFHNCSGFNGNLTISKGLTEIQTYVFAGCSGFSGSLIIPENVTKIADDAFSGCSGFNGSLIIPNSVTEMAVTGGGAFSGCSGFSGSLIIPNSITEIGYAEFNNCSGFSGNLVIPNSVTKIKGRAFQGCGGLGEKLIIPNSVREIKRDAFKDCKGLNDIIFEGDAPDMEEFAGNIVADVYYPSGKSGWNSVVGNNYGGTLTWIPYGEASTSMPSIWLISNSDKNVTYIEGKGYSPNPFSINFSVWYYEEAPATCDDVKVTVILPDGLSFSETSDMKQKEYFIGTMDSTNARKDFKDEVYVITEEKREKFDIQVMATASGYDLAQEDTMEVPISSVIDYDSYELRVYSKFTSCIIGVNDQFELRPVMDKDGEALKNETGFSFIIADTGIIDISKTRYDDFGPVVTLKGKSVGSTTLKITHVPSGKDITINLSVVDGIKSYNISDMKNWSSGEGIYNAHIFMDNFKTAKNGDGYDVTFDAYNELHHVAAVEVYDKDGKLRQIEKINRFKYETGLKDVWDSGVGLFVTVWNGDLSSIKASIYTEHTSVKIWVPDGGSFVVTNNLSESMGAYMLNTAELYCFAISVITDQVNSKESLEKVIDVTQKKTVKELLKKIASSIEIQKKFKAKAEDTVMKTLLNKVNLTMANNVLGNFVDEAQVPFQDLEINLEEVFLDASIESGFSVSQKIIEDLGGRPGIVLKGLFAVNKYTDVFLQLFQMSVVKEPGIKVYLNEESDYLVSNDVIVQSKDGNPLTGNELIVTDISKEESSQYIIEKFNGSDKIRIMDITMYRDNQEVQPDGTIRIKIPLPLGYSQVNSSIYRVETDGTLTDMKAAYADGYMIFETDHLSKYVLVDPSKYEAGEKTFTVTFNLQGHGSVLEEYLGYTGIKGGSRINKPEEPKENNYIFTGWYRDSVCTNLWDFDSDTVEEDMVLYAGWKAENNSGNTGAGDDNTDSGNTGSDGDNAGDGNGDAGTGGDTNEGNGSTGTGGNPGGGSGSSGNDVNTGENGGSTEDSGNHGEASGDVNGNNSNNGNINSETSGVTISTENNSSIDSGTGNPAGSRDNGNGTNGADNAASNIDSGNGVSNSHNNGTLNKEPAKDAEPKTEDATPVEIYATVAMVAGFLYLLLYFADEEKGMTEDEKNEMVAALVRWGKKGSWIRRYAALAAILFLLVYYYSIGKRTSVKWKEVYGR